MYTGLFSANYAGPDSATPICGEGCHESCGNACSAFGGGELGYIGEGEGEWVPETYKYVGKGKGTFSVFQNPVPPPPPSKKLYILVPTCILMSLLVLPLLFILLKPSTEVTTLPPTILADDRSQPTSFRSTPITYDCMTDNMAEWSVEQNLYCCTNFKMGCMTHQMQFRFAQQDVYGTG